MAKKKSRRERLSDAHDAIADQLADVEAVRDELQEWLDNLSGTNLENTAKAGELEDSIGSLGEVIDNITSALDDLDQIEPPAAR